MAGPSDDRTGLARSSLMMLCGERGSPPQLIIPGLVVNSLSS